MSELQSNAAFHLYQNPLYHYRRPVVLLPSLMYGEDTRTFWCAVNGGGTPPFDISVDVNVNVNGSKKNIKEEMARHDVAASALEGFYLFIYVSIVMADSTILPAKRPRACGTSTYSWAVY